MYFYSKLCDMMALKWTGGLILAGILALGSANLIMHHTGKYDMNNLDAFQYWITFLLVPSIGFGLFVLLSCVFVPVQKKYAAITVFLLCLIFISMGAYQHFIDNNNYLPGQFIVRYTGITLGLVTGYIISYSVFKKNHWSK